MCGPMSPDPNIVKSPTEFASSVIRSMGEIQPATIIPDDDDDLGHVVLEEDLVGLQINDELRNRFFGKSSGAMLLQAAMDLKDEYTGQPKRSFPRPNILSRRRDEFWSRPDVCLRLAVICLAPDLSIVGTVHLGTQESQLHLPRRRPHTAPCGCLFHVLQRVLPVTPPTYL